MIVRRPDGVSEEGHPAASTKYVLEPGGAKPAAVLVHDFLGRDYNFEAYARWLAN